MRIAFVTLQYPPDTVGGIGSYVQTVAAALSAAGHSVTVVCATGDQPRSSEVVDGVRIERFPDAGPRWLRRAFVVPRQRFRTRLLAAWSSFVALRRLGTSFDVVEAPEWKAQGLLLRLARRGPVVVHVHLPLDLEFAWNDKGRSRGARLACLLERLTARVAHARTVTTSQTLRYPDGTWWLPMSSVHLVAPPLTDRPWDDVDAVEGTDPVVLFVGRLERRKAPEDVVDALAALDTELAGLKAVFVGKPMRRGDDRYDEVLMERAKAAGVEIEVREPVADPEAVRQLFGEARVVAVPSLFETLSMVALEAMASGRPVVMTSHVGAAELIGDDLADLVVPAKEPAALAAALRPHLVDVDHAARVGERCRAVASRLTDASVVAESRLAVYRRVHPR